MKNLYELMDYKRKNSILKSVYIGQTRFNKFYRVVEVNPYSDDKTALNALEGTPIKYKNAIRTIEKTLSKLEKRAKIHRNVYRIFILINTVLMRFFMILKRERNGKNG